MFVRSLVALTALAWTTMASPSPQQFDLVCTGAGADTANGAFKPVDVRLTVDLSRRLWCESSCVAINPIADVQPGAIWFEKESDAETAAGLTHWRAVNRVTGEYHYARDIPEVGRLAVVSQCQAAPFSGFPKIGTKF